MPRVVHFELSAEDPERATRFYSEVFGWKINKWEGPEDYWLISTGDNGTLGIDGGMTRRQEQGGGTVNTVDVPDLDKYLRQIEANGGKVVAPRMTIPGVGYFASCQDTEGNAFGVLQGDANAA